MATTTNFAEAIGNCIMRQVSGGNVACVTAYPTIIDSDFYNEMTLVFEYMSGSRLVVGVIQRTEGAECEAHS